MKILVLSILAYTNVSVACDDQLVHVPNEETVTAVNETKYCYYDSKEYSRGSILKHVDALKICDKSSDGKKLIWVEESKL